jgi:hypothetical protein
MSLRLHDHLRQHLVVAADTFPDQDILIGLAVPNRSANDNLYIMQVLDAAKRDNDIKAEADHWRRQGIFKDSQHPSFVGVQASVSARRSVRDSSYCAGLSIDVA